MKGGNQTASADRSPFDPAPAIAPPREPYADRVLIALFVAVIALLFWQLSGAFTLLFGGVVVATVLSAIASLVQRLVPLPARWSVIVAILMVVIMLLVSGWLMGDRVAAQVGRLFEQLPAALDATMQWLRSHPIGQQLLESWSAMADRGIPWVRIAAAGGVTVGALGNVGLMIVIGIYLAFDPSMYRRGVVRLIPQRHRCKVADALAASGKGLSAWLLGQGISMLFVGSATAAGLALLGMPLALSLGLIAGLLGFVPFFGPIASGALITLLAFAEGPDQALWVLVLAFSIQFVEGNVLMPIVQRRAVALPPVLGMMAVVIFGTLFGVSGIVFATPMMVVLMVLVQHIYVKEVLEAK